MPRIFRSWHEETPRWGGCLLPVPMTEIFLAYFFAAGASFWGLFAPSFQLREKYAKNMTGIFHARGGGLGKGLGDAGFYDKNILGIFQAYVIWRKFREKTSFFSAICRNYPKRANRSQKGTSSPNQAI